jgi:outer membrane protein OmpA-like peptidoglycan-associated protein
LKIQPEKPIIFNIYFESDNATILASSSPTIDSAYNTLSNNPSLKAEIDGHVNWPKNWSQKIDTIGLQKLSEERAKTVSSLLVRKGIAANRISPKGYSNTKMIFPKAATNAEQERNRRTEIIITSDQ